MIGVTGSKGVIGKLVCVELTKRNLQFSTYEDDIRNDFEFYNWLVVNNITSIIHLASKVAIKDVNENPALAYDVNVNGTIQIINAIQKINRSIRFFYASSSHVYKSSSSPIREDFEIAPLNTYGLTKYISEQLLQDYSKNNKNLKLCVGRIFSFYHDSQIEPYLYPTLKKRLSNEDLNKPFKLLGAHSVRDFLNAERVSEIVIILTLSNFEGIVNIGSGEGVMIKDFVSSLTDRKLNYDIDINDAVNYLVADTSKLKNILNND